MLILGKGKLAVFSGIADKTICRQDIADHLTHERIVFNDKDFLPA